MLKEAGQQFSLSAISKGIEARVKKAKDSTQRAKEQREKKEEDYETLSEKQEITGDLLGLANSGYGISNVLREAWGISAKKTLTADDSCYGVGTGDIWRA